MADSNSLKSLLMIFAVAAAALAAAMAPYEPPQVISAVDLKPPANTLASGVAVLDVSIDSAGAVAGAAVVRDLPPLATAAQSAVQLWKFRPAMSDGGAQPSDLLAAFVLGPAESFPAYPEFPALLHQQSSRKGFIFPGIVSVAYAPYPAKSVVSGSVVVQATIGADGNAIGWLVLRDLPPCTQLALDAAKKWKFSAASLDGAPVASTVAIDFLFQPPVVSPL
jgi:outer membrane biosynthesis protein TonB